MREVRRVTREAIRDQRAAQLLAALRVEEERLPAQQLPVLLAMPGAVAVAVAVAVAKAVGRVHARRESARRQAYAGEGSGRG